MTEVGGERDERWKLRVGIDRLQTTNAHGTYFCPSPPTSTRTSIGTNRAQTNRRTDRTEGRVPFAPAYRTPSHYLVFHSLDVPHRHLSLAFVPAAAAPGLLLEHVAAGRVDEQHYGRPHVHLRGARLCVRQIREFSLGARAVSAEKTTVHLPISQPHNIIHHRNNNNQYKNGW